MPQAQQGMNISDSAQVNPGIIVNSDLADDTLLNAKINSAAAIAYSKLALGLSIVNADIATGAAIAYAKLNLALSIINADIATGAAIARSKLDFGSGLVNADIAAAAAIAMSKLTLAITNSEVAAGAAIVDTKLAQIATASKVSGAALTLLTSIPAGAGVIPAANLPSIAVAAFPGTQVANNTSIGATFQDLNVSSVVGTNRALVLISLVSNGAGQSDTFYARENGNIVNASTDQSVYATDGPGRTAAGQKWVLTDASGIIEVRSTIATVYNAWVEAYLKS